MKTKFIAWLLFFLVSYQAQAFHLFHYDFPSLEQVVGTQEFTLIDPTRFETHTEEKINRELPIRAWYPAIDQPEKPFAKWGYSKRDLIFDISSQEAPRFVVEMVYQGQVRSKENLLVKPGTYPVIFLLHGLGGGPIEEHTDLAETFASKGYFVIGLEFPYGAAVSKISQLKDPVGPSAKLTEILSRYPDSKPELIAYRKTEHKLWVEDFSFVMKELRRNENPLFKFVNLNEIYIIGHSHGGMVALESCLNESACKASVNMDGWTYELEFPRDLKKHLVLYTISSGAYFKSFCKEKENCFLREINECDMAHSGFSDKIFIKWPFTRFTGNQCGSKSVETKQLVHQLIDEFFKK